MTDAIMGEMVEELMVFARQGVGSGEVEVNLRSVIADTVDQCKGTFDRPGIAAGGAAAIVPKPYKVQDLTSACREAVSG